ncbi:MAG: GNAT family N-acetyltransferase [Dehalococcoidia bacterium]
MHPIWSLRLVRELFAQPGSGTSSPRRQHEDIARARNRPSRWHVSACRRPRPRGHPARLRRRRGIRQLPLATLLARSAAFWEQVASSVGRNETALLVARDEQGIQGTVQLLLSLPENQPHRAEVAKLLVHRRARRRGIAAALMAGVEREAHAEQRSLLTLDTASDDARRLYDRMGWSLCGRIPGYALNPDRSVCDTWIYWKRME